MNEAVLLNAAERVFTYALSDHMRVKDREGITSLSTGWIHNIIDQMELDKFHSPMECPETRRRGRPKKVMQVITPNELVKNSTMAQTRSKSKNGTNMAAIDSIFSLPGITTSPIKANHKVIVQQDEEGNSSPTKRKVAYVSGLIRLLPSFFTEF